MIEAFEIENDILSIDLKKISDEQRKSLEELGFMAFDFERECKKAITSDESKARVFSRIDKKWKELYG